MTEEQKTGHKGRSLYYYPFNSVMLLQLGAILCFLAQPRVGWPAVARPVCNDPARKQLEEAWGQGGVNAWHDSLFNLGNFHAHLTEVQFRNVPMEYLAVRTYHLGSTTCPHDFKNRSTNRIEICPSYDVINYDPNRIPDTLFEKRCSSCSGFCNRSSAMTMCMEMKYPTRVLRRVNCINNTFIYTVIAEPLTVGCYCDIAPARSTRSSN